MYKLSYQRETARQDKGSQNFVTAEDKKSLITHVQLSVFTR